MLVESLRRQVTRVEVIRLTVEGMTVKLQTNFRIYTFLIALITREPMRYPLIIRLTKSLVVSHLIYLIIFQKHEAVDCSVSANS